MVTHQSETEGRENRSQVSRRSVLSSIKGASFAGLSVAAIGSASASSQFYDIAQDSMTGGGYLDHEATHASSVTIYNPTPETDLSTDYWEFTVQVVSECVYYDNSLDLTLPNITGGKFSLDWPDNASLEPVTTYRDDTHIGAWDDLTDSSYSAGNFFFDTAVNTGVTVCGEIPVCGQIEAASSWVYDQIGYLSDWLVADDHTYFELYWDRDNGHISNSVAFDVNLSPGDDVTLDIYSEHEALTIDPRTSYSIHIPAPDCSPTNGYPCGNSLTTDDSVSTWSSINGKEIQKNPGKFGIHPSEAKKYSPNRSYSIPQTDVQIETIPRKNNDAYQNHIDKSE